MSQAIGLRELQQQFSDAIFAQGDQRQQAVDRLAPFIDSDRGLSTAKHLDIYRNSVHGQLSEALHDIFPVCVRLVGERFFDQQCRRYIAAHPSSAPDIGHFGRAFPAHIATAGADAGLPYLGDVAALEWAWHVVFNAPAQPPLDLVALSGVAAESQGALCLQPPLASRLLDSDYPILAIWQSNQPDDYGDQHIDLDSGGDRLLVWRDSSTVQISRPEAAQWQTLALLYQGLALDPLTTRLAARTPPVDTQSVIPELMQNGWIASFSIAHG